MNRLREWNRTEQQKYLGITNQIQEEQWLDHPKDGPVAGPPHHGNNLLKKKEKTLEQAEAFKIKEKKLHKFSAH